MVMYCTKLYKRVHTESHGAHHEALGGYTHVDQVHGHLCVAASFHLPKSVRDDGKEPHQSCSE